MRNLRLKLVSLFIRGIPANRTDVDQSIPELNECSPLLRQLQLRHVSQHEVNELLILLLTKPLDERSRRERNTETERGETVFGETEVEQRGDGKVSGTELFLLFGEVRAADEADGAFVAELREDLEHFGRDALLF